MAGKLRNKSAAASPRAATRRPPSARRARKAAVVRRRLIEAALSGFEKRGFTRTTIDLITEGADVGKGTFYNYFGTKEALLAAWGRRILAEAIRADEPLAEAGEPPLRRLFALFHQLLNPLEKRPRLAAPLLLAFVFLSHEAQEEEDRSPTASDDGDSDTTNRTLVEVLEPIAAEAIEQGLIRPDKDAPELARALAGVFFQTLSLLATGADTRPPAEQLRAWLPLALEGLAAAEE